MANFDGCWPRLERVITWAKMSINFFAYHIGLSRPDVIYRIKAGRMGISQALARRVVDKFPEVSLGWLLSGEGSMLGHGEGVGMIPYFDGNIADAIRLFSDNATPQSYLHLPMVGECDCAVRCYDEAMADEITPGVTIFLKKTDINTIVPGGIYLIVCSNFILLRRVRIETGTDGRVLVLEATNKSFDVLTISPADVVQLFKLEAALRLY